MKNYAWMFMVIATGISPAAFAKSYRCSKVTSIYPFSVEGAIVDPRAGIFMTFITDAGSGFELWEKEITSFTGYNFKRSTECKETSISKGAKIQKLFECDGKTKDGAIHFNSTLTFDTKIHTGSYRGRVSGANPLTFKFDFENCTHN